MSHFFKEKKFGKTLLIFNKPTLCFCMSYELAISQQRKGNNEKPQLLFIGEKTIHYIMCHLKGNKLGAA